MLMPMPQRSERGERDRGQSSDSEGTVTFSVSFGEGTQELPFRVCQVGVWVQAPEKRSGSTKGIRRLRRAHR